jgi:hypothetical protein
MSIRQTVPDNIAAVASLLEEVRELRKLAMNCRAASLALFRNNTKQRLGRWAGARLRTISFQSKGIRHVATYEVRDSDY